VRAAGLTVPVRPVRPAREGGGLDRVRAFGFPVDSEQLLDLPTTFAQARDSARVLAADLAGDRGFRALDVDEALEAALDRAHHDTDRLLDRDLDIDREHAARLEIEVSLANHLQADDMLVDDLTVTLDLVGDLAITEWPLDTAPLLVTVRAYGDLLTSWVPAPWNGRPGEFLNNFDYSLVTGLSTAVGTMAPDDPDIALDRTHDLLDRTSPRPDQADLLILGVRDLVTPILDGDAPWRAQTLACARLGLLALTTRLQRSGENDVAAPALDALRGLVALQGLAEGELTPNDVLLLVRA
jgi:hypothetical protein